MIKINKHTVFIFVFITTFILSIGCKRCKVEYLNKPDTDLQNKTSIIQDNTVIFHCLSNYGDVNAISIDFRFATKNIYNVTNLDIQIKTDNGDKLKLTEFNNLLENNLNVRYSSSDSIPIDLPEIISKYPRTTEHKISKYKNVKDYYLRFSNKKYIKTTFIVVKIHAVLTKNSEIIKYDKEFKLFPAIDCYYD